MTRFVTGWAAYGQRVGLTVKVMHVQIHLSLAGANSYWVMWATCQGKVSLCSADISLTVVLSAHLQISLPSKYPAVIEAALSVRTPEKLWNCKRWSKQIQCITSTLGTSV